MATITELKKKVDDAEKALADFNAKHQAVFDAEYKAIETSRSSATRAGVPVGGWAAFFGTAILTQDAKAAADALRPELLQLRENLRRAKYDLLDVEGYW